MGLLLGRWAGNVAIVEGSIALPRSDRRKDRVEVGYEQLAMATEVAEKQANDCGREVCDSR